MTRRNYFYIVLFLLASCGVRNTNSKLVQNKVLQAREYYQLKTYVLASEAQEKVVDTYLKNAFLPALKKLNIKNIGVFKLKPEEKDTLKKTVVLIPFSSINQFLELEEALEKDAAHLAAGKAYLNASYESPPYVRIESVLMQAFSDMPFMQASPLKSPRSQRIYELRSYESSTETYYKKKVDMFNAGGEIRLFDRLGFNSVFYAEVISGDKMPNLMYMTTFDNRNIRDELWKAFFDSPQWTALKRMDKYKNSVSHADIYFLYPTEYSDY